jgi:hypothetical protein
MYLHIYSRALQFFSALESFNLKYLGFLQSLSIIRAYFNKGVKRCTGTQQIVLFSKIKPPYNKKLKVHGVSIR